MGTTISCEVKGIMFYNNSTRKRLENRIIELVVKEQHSRYVGEGIKIQSTLCTVSNKGLEWSGGVNYDNQTGTFTIVKTRLLQRLCECVK